MLSLRNHTCLPGKKKFQIKNNIIKGTLILTIAGLLTRIIGFFYRIYLSNHMGAELMGIYQMVFPVYGICFTLYASGIQTAISKLVAAEIGKKNKQNLYRILKIGLVLSVVIASLLSLLLYTSASLIATNFMMEPRTTDSLRVLSLVFPFCGITACINGYYYGKKEANVPAISQLLEQLVRVIAVYLIAAFAGQGNGKVSCELAVFGVVIGEVSSCFYNLSSLRKKSSSTCDDTTKTSGELLPSRLITKEMVALSIPLTSNHLFLSILHSVEAILIPAMLKKFGLTTSEALSIYGIVTGMSMPFIVFPNALTNALAVLLLPTVSEAQARQNYELIGKTTSITIKYCLIIGIISTGVFVSFGQALGECIFHNQQAGYFLTVLAWLCPFLYLTTTLGSIINGLGKAYISFFNNTVGLLVRILCILLIVPRAGIYGYLICLLVSQLLTTFLDGSSVMRTIKFPFDAVNSILKPGLITIFICRLLKPIYEFLYKLQRWNDILLCLLFCLLFCSANLALLYICKAIGRKDF